MKGYSIMKRKVGLIVLALLALMAVSASVSAQVPSRCADASGAPIPCTPTPEPGTGTTGGATADDPDGDGIVNTFDACPNEGGPSNNSGCPMGPDADGDGTSDDRDVCPTEGGPASNNGCPETTTTGGSQTAVPPSDFTALPALPDDNFCHIATATTQGVNLRAKPSINAEVLAVLDPQANYFVLQGVYNEGQLWYYVDGGVDGWLGFVAASAVRTTEECASIELFYYTPLANTNTTALHVRLPPPQHAPEGYLVIELEDLIISSATGSESPEFEGPDDFHVCLFNVDFGAVTCDDDDGPYNPPGSPEGQAATANFVCSYHKGLDKFICLDDFTAAPSEDPTAGDSSRNPYMLGPEDIGMCLYHPDYGTVICDPTPDGTYDPAAGATGDEQGGCVFSPDQLYVVCDHTVQDGTGRIGQMGMICDVAQNLCAGKVLTAPDGGDCPEAIGLLLPAVQAAREAARRMQATNGNLQIVDLTSFAATIPDADPCGVNTYQFTQAMDEVFDDLGGVEPPPQTREHILLARQIGVPT
jgi:hypothetical protein